MFFTIEKRILVYNLVIKSIFIVIKNVLKDSLIVLDYF